MRGVSTPPSPFSVWLSVKRIEEEEERNGERNWKEMNFLILAYNKIVTDLIYQITNCIKKWSRLELEQFVCSDIYNRHLVGQTDMSLVARNVWDFDYSLTSPHKRSVERGSGMTLSLESSRRKLCFGRGFVNRSIGWSFLEMTQTRSLWAATCSRMKWKSTSMCFILAWNTGLVDR